VPRKSPAAKVSSVCTRCGRPLKVVYASVARWRKTTICQVCWRSGGVRKLPVNRCACGAVIQRRSAMCMDCHRKDIARRNKLQATSLAEKRANVSWSKRVSKAELQCRELLDALGLLWKGQVPFGTFVIDFMLFLEDRRLAVEVLGDYWHSTPVAVERDARRRELLLAAGFHVVELHVSRMHLWWRTLREACASAPSGPARLWTSGTFPSPG
jgi:very-short-patch-repair endonuclease